jgi:branched-subunit amino acid transport protein
VSAWPVIVAMAAVTYALRVAPLVVVSDRLGTALERWLRYLPPALFAALIVPSLLAPAGAVQTGPRLWAGLVGLAIGWRTRSIPATIIVGLGMFAVFRWMAGR